MKNYIIYISIVGILFLNACKSTSKIPSLQKNLIAHLNMVSTRNIDQSVKYKLLRSYAGLRDKDLLEIKDPSLENAINQTVKKTPGGEYLMNVNIYAFMGTDNKSYYAVEGDIYGNPENVNVQGFKVGDKVTWKKKSLFGKKIVTGVITALKDETSCYVMLDASNKKIEIKYDDLAK